MFEIIYFENPEKKLQENFEEINKHKNLFFLPRLINFKESLEKYPKTSIFLDQLSHWDLPTKSEISKTKKIIFDLHNWENYYQYIIFRKSKILIIKENNLNEIKKNLNQIIAKIEKNKIDFKNIHFALEIQKINIKEIFKTVSLIQKFLNQKKIEIQKINFYLKKDYFLDSEIKEIKNSKILKIKGIITNNLPE